MTDDKLTCRFSTHQIPSKWELSLLAPCLGISGKGDRCRTPPPPNTQCHCLTRYAVLVCTRQLGCITIGYKKKWGKKMLHSQGMSSEGWIEWLPVLCFHKQVTTAMTGADKDKWVGGRGVAFQHVPVRELDDSSCRRAAHVSMFGSRQAQVGASDRTQEASILN